ncbi:MAG: hypothetical protein WDN28_27370 [Chthoniobacter sp.]
MATSAWGASLAVTFPFGKLASSSKESNWRDDFLGALHAHVQHFGGVERERGVCLVKEPFHGAGESRRRS